MGSLWRRTVAISVAALLGSVGIAAAGASADDSPDPECAPDESSTTTTDAPEPSAPQSSVPDASTSTTIVECPGPSTSVPESTSPATTSPASTTTSTSEGPDLDELEPPVPSPPPLPLVAELSSPVVAVPERGIDRQVAETLPPPTTTTTTTMPPPEWALPAQSGEGRRVVYRKSWPMRVWTVEADGSVSKTHLVSGRATWNQPAPGTYSVFSRSNYTCNINNPNICWRYMVRFTKGPEGDNIGLHEIPTNLSTGYKLQSESQLGLPLSGGCVRQRASDALYIWNWAPVGTAVVVLP